MIVSSICKGVMEKEITFVKQWIHEIVIGLNLCPFAASVFSQELIRYHASGANNSSDILSLLQEEFELLDAHKSDELSTTILVLPNLKNFDEYLERVDLCNLFLDRSPYRGFFQLATFHPCPYVRNKDRLDGAYPVPVARPRPSRNPRSVSSRCRDSEKDPR